MAGTMHRIAVFVDCRTGNAIDMPVAGAMRAPEIARLLEIIGDAEQALPGFCALAHTGRMSAGRVSYRALSVGAVLVRKLLAPSRLPRAIPRWCICRPWRH